jgi:hypothetical protein
MTYKVSENLRAAQMQHDANQKVALVWTEALWSGVEDYELAMVTYRAAIERWLNTPITLQQGARVIEDSRRLRLAWSDKGRQGGR